MTQVTSRSEPLFHLVRVRLRFASRLLTLFGLVPARSLQYTVRVRLRFDKISVKPVYKTPVRFDSLGTTKAQRINAKIIISSSVRFLEYYSFFIQTISCSRSSLTIDVTRISDW